jgi:hypothetical protein
VVLALVVAVQVAVVHIVAVQAGIIQIVHQLLPVQQALLAFSQVEAAVVIMIMVQKRLEAPEALVNLLLFGRSDAGLAINLI